jgi:starch-binding outer membrane protein, SusD/RagB family
MKQLNIRFLLPAILLMFVWSCTDLDVDVKSEYTTSNFPSTDSDMEAVCGPAYTTFKVQYGRNMWLVQTCSSDEGMMAVNGGNWYDNGYYQQLDLHTWTSDNSMTSGIWEGLFSGISYCNQILSILNASTVTSSAKTTAIAQVRVMRALYYFWAMDNFGALPIIDTFGEDTPARSSRSDVANFIVSELTDCMDDLPTTVSSSTYGKPTEYMAEALLAKIYLNWAVYTADDVANYSPSNSNSHLNDVVSLCDNIIDSGNYNLADDWISKFKDTNSSSIKDFIFAIPYDWSTDNTYYGGGITHARFWCHKYMQYTLGMTKKPSGPLRAIPEFVDIYNLTGDKRNNIWYGGIQYYTGTTTPYTVTMSKGTLNQYYKGSDLSSDTVWTFTLSKELTIRGSDSADSLSNLNILDFGNDEIGLAMGYRNLKFYPSLTSTNNFQSNDAPILRYADVLLMKAEAILRGATATNGDTPASLVNQVRDCADAPNVSTIDLDELLEERAREFSDECWRRNDLIRFGKFENDWGFKSAKYGNSNTDEYRRIFAVPRSVMLLNTSWTQNNGYSD